LWENNFLGEFVIDKTEVGGNYYRVRQTETSNPTRAAALPALGLPHNIPVRLVAVAFDGFITAVAQSPL
jgi:hypothetical protein